MNIFVITFRKKNTWNLTAGNLEPKVDYDTMKLSQ
jgi:hypothetical protein